MRSKALIFITHPDLKGAVKQVPQQSFDFVWAQRGWQVVVETGASTSDGEQDVPLAELTRDKLLAIAEALEIEVSKSWNKGQIVEAIEAKHTGAGPELTTNTEGDQPDNDAQEG